MHTTKCGNIITNPFNSLALVKEAQILISNSWSSSGESKDVDAVTVGGKSQIETGALGYDLLHADNNNVVLCC
jgi:hypothetical protein